MAYNDVAKPARTGITTAKHGDSIIFIPGLTVSQVLSDGYVKPVDADESRLNNRFDDPTYYGAAAAAPSGPSSVTMSAGTITDLNDLEFNWTNPNNALTSNDQYATATFGFGNGPEPSTLRFSNFGFSIPVDKTIVGIVLEVERKASASNAIKDGFVTMRRGTTNSNNKGKVGNWSTVEAYEVYGANNDLWGLTWTPAQINDSTFAANINVASDAAGTASIDHVRVTVYYQ